MLVISGASFDPSALVKEYTANSVEGQLLNKMADSGEKYRYDNVDQLKFELMLRKEIVNAATDLHHSGLNFAGFENSRCNAEYWNRTPNGGFRLKEGAKPHEAIGDIFANGGKYATECATAMMIVYYRALLNVYGVELFNKTFSAIYLMDWDVREPLLREVSTPKKAADMLLGDRAYFNNLDYNPQTPQWEGENVIVLPNDLYYGHGIGLTTAENIIAALNANRKEGAAQSAYLLKSVGRPSFPKLAGVYYNLPLQSVPLVWGGFPPPLAAT